MFIERRSDTRMGKKPSHIDVYHYHKTGFSMNPLDMQRLSHELLQEPSPTLKNSKIPKAGKERPQNHCRNLASWAIIF